MLCSLNSLSLLQSCRRPTVKQLPNAGDYDWQSPDDDDMSDGYPSDTEYNPYYDDNDYPFGLSDSDLYSDDMNDEQQQPLNLCTVNKVMKDIMSVDSKRAGDVDEREMADIMHFLDSPSTSVVGGLQTDHKLISLDSGDSGDTSEVVESVGDLQNDHKVISPDSRDTSEVVESVGDLQNDHKVISPDSGDTSEVVESVGGLQNDCKVISPDSGNSGDTSEVVESVGGLQNDCKVISPALPDSSDVTVNEAQHDENLKPSVTQHTSVVNVTLDEANNQDIVMSADSQDM